MDYAILDIETTGGNYNEEKITEIAVFRFDGENVTDTFISLVNPEKEIQPFVQRLTGVTQKMVKTAPKFHEIARRLVEITQETTIVAHNVVFDYRVIKREFEELGYDFEHPQLDTIPLSKELIPDLKSYSLGKMCRALGIPLTDRHRASGDARATVKLFKLLLDKDMDKDIIQSSIKSSKNYTFNKKILSLLEDLPQKMGVIYFHDKDGKIIYIDKSENIANRTRQILTGKTAQFIKIQKHTENITFEFTGSSIVAEIKEWNELIANPPKFNTRKKQKIKIKQNLPDPLADKDFVLLTGKGRTRGEKSFLLLVKGVLQGYGFYTLHSQINSMERIRKLMTSCVENPFIHNMIRESMQNFEKVLILSEQQKLNL
ncbi:MAG: ribonuclease H-like domain-containing protein [Flavobacteriaceae bacterium]|jgi:DNA polymerase-3 subunit epsilon|nr:ribonuclease H-like domain-containing protein [Flavobacteriaceae bacterium]